MESLSFAECIVTFYTRIKLFNTSSGKKALKFGKMKLLSLVQNHAFPVSKIWSYLAAQKLLPDFFVFYTVWKCGGAALRIFIRNIEKGFHLSFHWINSYSLREKNNILWEGRETLNLLGSFPSLWHVLHVSLTCLRLVPIFGLKWSEAPFWMRLINFAVAGGWKCLCIYRISVSV